MADHFEIKIRVAYDKAIKLPDDMEQQLRDNVDRCVQRAELLNDSDLECIVEDWSVDVRRI